MPSAKELLEETKEPEVTGMNRVVDFIAQRLNPEWFATSGRTLLETAQGTKTPITEKNFKPEELDVIRQLVDVKGKDKGSISYADYIQLARKIAKEKGEPLPSSVTPSLFSMADPLGNIQTTLGRFTYQTDPKGNLQIIDRYDFNPPMQQDMREARTGDYGAFGPYGMIREYAGEKIPPGKGRDVRINLGPRKRFEGGGEVIVPRGTSEVPQLDPEGRLIDEREDIRSESQRMLNRLQSQPSKLPPGLRRTVAATRAQGKESMFPAAAPARDLLSGILGASPTAPGSEAYRTGQAIANMPPVQAAAAIPAKVAASAGDAATALAAMGPAMAGAVRPYGKGTVFSGVKLSSGRDVQSSLDRYIDQGKSAAFSIGDVNTADAVQKFFDTKARRYMSTQLGTEKDPIFDAIKKGRISNLALHDMRNLRKYAIEAAGEGKYKVDKETGKPVMDAYGRPIFYPKDPRAVMDVTEGYDEMVDVRPMSLKPGLIPQSYYTSDPLYRAEVERINDQMRQAFEAEGLDPRLVNFVREPMILTSARDTGKPYYSGYLHNLDDFIQAKLSGDPEATKNVPENVRRALDQGEILYDVAVRPGPLQEILDPENMADYLATLSPKEIDKIRFEDAVVGSAKFNREKIDRKFEGQRIKELVESGKAPDSIFSKGVSEPLLQFDKDQRHPGFAWKRIEDLEATIPEGAYVGHSVGGYALGGAGYGPRYTKGFEEGTHEIYSLRNARNRPVTTIQVINHGSKDAPYRVVEQIKGNGAKTGNTAPVDYDEEVYDFLTQVVKPDAIQESDRYLTPMLIQYRDALEANRQTR